jgi:HSP20 family protein
MADQNQQSDQRSQGTGGQSEQRSAGTSGQSEQRSAGASGTGANQSSGASAAGDTERSIPVSGEAGTRATRTERERGERGERGGRGERDRSGGSRTATAGRGAVGGRLPLSPWAVMRQLMENDLQRLLGVPSLTQQQQQQNLQSQTGTGMTNAPRTGMVPAGAWVPDVEVIERPNDVLVRVDLPGLQADEIDVNVDEGLLTISGVREEERREEQEGVVRTERVYGEFFRTIPLPETADIEHVQAQMRNGVLEITVPVARREQARRVAVKS